MTMGMLHISRHCTRLCAMLLSLYTYMFGFGVFMCRVYTICPKKITIGLSAWITFKVVSESKYNFKLWKYDYFSTFQWRPHLIWSSNHIEIWIFVKQVTGPLFQVLPLECTWLSQTHYLHNTQTCKPFKFYAYHSNKDWSWQPKRLSDM